MPAAHSHCSFCGHRFAQDARWPRACTACGSVSYHNPLPVAVMVLPVAGGGVVCVRRAIPPRGLALPGGFIEAHESWQAAAAREAAEETGIRVDPGSIRVLEVRSAPDGTLLVFGLAAPVAPSALKSFVASEEVSSLEVVASAAEELVFPLHAEVLAGYLAAPTAGGDAAS